MKDEEYERCSAFILHPSSFILLESEAQGNPWLVLGLQVSIIGEVKWQVP
jgi:hypothetical protein